MKRVLAAALALWAGSAFAQVFNPPTLDSLGIGTADPASIGSLVIGTPTGGDKGAGTVNPAGAVYDNGTAPTGTANSGYVRATSPTLVRPVLTDQIDQEAHILTSTFTKTDTTFSTGTLVGLSQALTAGGLYSCSGHVHFTTAPTILNGVKVMLATPDTLTVNTLQFTVIGFNGAAFMINGTGTASALGSQAMAATQAGTDLLLSAAINVNVAGTLAVRIAENVASGTVEVTAGNARWECHRAA